MTASSIDRGALLCDLAQRAPLVSAPLGASFIDLCCGRLVFRQPEGISIDLVTAARAGAVTAAWCDPDFGGDRDAVLPLELRRARDAFLRSVYTTDGVRRFIEGGMDPNVIDRNGRTLLHQAAFGGCHAVAEILCDAGARPDISDRYGMTPLHDASTRGHDPIVDILLDAGADPDIADNQSWTPVFWAVVGSFDGIVGSLAAAGADIDRVDADGQTPITIGLEYGSVAAVRCLVDSGATVDRADLNSVGELIGRPMAKPAVMNDGGNDRDRGEVAAEESPRDGDVPPRRHTAIPAKDQGFWPR